MANIGTIVGTIQLRDLFSSPLKSAGVSIAAFSALAVKAASDFESSFAGVRKTVNATEAEFGRLAQGFRNLAKEIPVGVNELNRFGEAAGQLGIAKESILGFTRVVADLGVTTNLAGDEAASALARIANITGLQQDQFDRLGSTIVALGNSFATTESEIVDFTLRIAGAGEIAGLTEAQIAGIGAAMSSVGVQAEAGGSSVQKVLLGMTQAVSTGGKSLTIFAETAGMSAAEFSAAFRDDAGAAFAAFVEGLGRQGTEAFTTLERLNLTDQRLIRSFLSLAGAGDLLARSMQVGTDAFAENNALTKEAEQRYQTFASQVTITKNLLNDLMIDAGQQLLPVLKEVNSTLQDLARNDDLASFIRSLGELIAGVVRVAGFFIEHLALIKFAILALLALRIQAWLVGLTASIATASTASVGLNQALLAIQAGYGRLVALNVAQGFGAWAVGIGGVTVALIALGVALNEVINAWRDASEAAIDHILVLSQADGALADLRKSLRLTGEVITEELDKKARAALSGLKGEVEREAKLLEKMQADFDRAGGFAGGFFDPEAKQKIEAQAAKVKELKDQYNELALTLLSVEVEAKKAGEATGGVPAPGVGQRTQEYLDALASVLAILSPLREQFEQLSRQNEALQLAASARDFELIAKAIEMGIDPVAALSETFSVGGVSIRAYLEHLIDLDAQIAANTAAMQEYIDTLGLGNEMFEERFGTLPGVEIELPEFVPMLDDETLAEAKKWMSDLTRDLAKIWDNFVEGMQRALVTFFEDAIRSVVDSFAGGTLDIEGLFKSLWRTVVDMAIRAAAEAAAAWAATKFVTNFTDGATGGGLSWGSIAKMFGGGGGGTPGLMGPTQSGGALGGGGGGGMATGAVAWGAVAGIVLGIAYGMGWIGSKGSQGVGGVAFGGEDLGVDDTWSNRSKNVKVVMDKVREAIKKIQEFVTEVELEIERFGDVVVEKHNQSYTAVATGITSDIRAALGQIDTAGMTADQLSDALATLAIRTAEFGPSVSAFLEAVIRGSEAITTAQLEAEIEMGRAIESMGKSDFEQKVLALGPKFDQMFDWLGNQLAGNVDQLQVGLASLIRGSAGEWRAAYNELMGIVPGPEELRAQTEANARIYEARKALEIARLKAEKLMLEAERDMTIKRAGFRRGELVAMVKLEEGRQGLALAELKAGHRNLGIRGQLYDAEQRLTQTFFETTGTIVSAAAEALNAQIAALDALIKELEAIPPIDFTKLKIPGLGGGKGGGLQDDIARDRETLRGILDTFKASELEGVAAALFDINRRFEESAKLAHGDAELLDELNKMREREIQLLRDQLALDVRQYVPGLSGSAQGPDGSVSMFGGDPSEWEQRAAEIAAWAAKAAEENQRLLEEAGQAALETWEIVAAEANRMRMLVEEAIGSLGLPLEQTRERFRVLGDTLDFLASQVEAGILSQERYADIIAQVADQAFLNFGDGLIAFLDRYYKDVEGYETLRRQLEAMRFTLEFANLQLQFQLLQEMGLLTKAQIELVGGLIKEIEDNFDGILDGILNPPELPTVPAGGFGGVSTENPLADRDRARDLLDRYLLDAMDPLTRALHQLEEDFDFIRLQLGNTAEVQAAYAEALERIMRQHLDSIERLQQQLLLGDASPLSSREQLATAQGMFDQAVARFRAGDLSVIADIPGIVQQYLAAARDFFPAGSEAYANIFRMVNAFLNEVLAVGNLPGMEIPGGPGLGAGGPGVSLPGFTPPPVGPASLDRPETLQAIREGNRELGRIERTVVSMVSEQRQTNVLLGERRFARQVA